MTAHRKTTRAEQEDGGIKKGKQPTEQGQIPHSQSVHQTASQRAIEDPLAARQEAVLQLQGKIGNQAMGQLIAQTKQSEGAPGAHTQRMEIEEKEPIQGRSVQEARNDTGIHPDSSQTPGEQEDLVQGKPPIQRQEEEEAVQMQLAGAYDAASGSSRVRGNGGGMTVRFGGDAFELEAEGLTQKVKNAAMGRGRASGIIQRRELKGSERTDIRQAVRFGLDTQFDSIKSTYKVAGSIEQYVNTHSEEGYDESNVRANLAYSAILRHNADFLGELLDSLPDDAREAGLAELDTMVKAALSEVCPGREFMRKAAYSYLKRPAAFREHLQAVVELAESFWMTSGIQKYVVAAFDHEKGYDETKDTLSGLGQATMGKEEGEEEAAYLATLVTEWLRQEVNTNVLEKGASPKSAAGLTREEMVKQYYSTAEEDKRQHFWSTLVTYFTNRHASVEAALEAISPETAALSELFTDQEIKEGRQLIESFYS